MADADERVSILGVLKDEISAPAKTAGAALGGIGIETQKTNDALNRLADILEKTQAAMQKSQEETAKVTKSLQDQTSAVDLNEQVNRRAITRTETLAIRLVALGYSLDSIGRSFGKVSIEADAFKSYIQTIGNTIAVFPNTFGAAAGVVLGLAAAFNKTAQAIDEINKKSKDLMAKFPKTLQAVYDQGGKSDVKDALDRNNPYSAINDRIKQLKDAADKEASEARKIEDTLDNIALDRNSRTQGSFEVDDKNRVTNLKGNIQASISEQFKKVQGLQEGSGFSSGDGGVDAQVEQQRKNALAEAQDVLNQLIKANTAQGASIDTLKEKQKAANLAMQESVNEIIDQEKALEAMKGFKGASDQLEGLLTSELKFEEQFRAGDITEAQFAKEKLAIETKRLEIYEKFKDYYGVEEAAQGNILGIQQDKVTAAEREIEALKEAKAYEDDARKAYDEGNKERDAQLKESAKLGQAVANTIGQGFEQATGAFIDGLVQGNLNMQQFAGQFALNLSKMIAQALVLKAVMAGLGAIGLNSGGQVPGGGGGGDSFGSGPQGMATGGYVPGPNVNADIVPAMLTPGEYVVKRSAVSRYGTAAMNAINRGLVPSSVLSRYSAPSTVSASSRHAQGGEIPYGAGAVPKPAMAFVMSSDGEMERLLAGGDGAFMRFFERNRGKIRANLGIGGR